MIILWGRIALIERVVSNRMGDAAMQKQIKLIVEKHPDGYVAYPVVLKGVVVAEGDTYEEALAEIKSAVEFHIRTFGHDVLDDGETVQEVFVTEAGIEV